MAARLRRCGTLIAESWHDLGPLCCLATLRLTNHHLCDRQNMQRLCCSQLSDLCCCCWPQVIKNEGMKSLFKGAGANILRAVAGAGVLSGYDQLQVSSCPVQVPPVTQHQMFWQCGS
jgi:hypothetical protein